MPSVYYIAHDIISSLGFGSEENANSLFSNKSGIKNYADNYFIPDPFCASRVDNIKLEEACSKISIDNHFTRFEQLLLCSVSNALAKSSVDIKSKETLLIISSTKGNIDLLEEERKQLFGADRVNLWKSAALVQNFFGNPNQPLIISHACISGLVAQIVASRYIESGQYKNVVVTGCDMVTPFVASGFRSLQALSPNPCKPFDKERNGLTLGEGVATVILSSNEALIKKETIYSFEAGSITNDANHISGPSRTGEGLYLALQNVLGRLNYPKVDFINAHGTATIYNDEMESVALSRAGLLHVPVNSFKGYIGHTLGAAGVIETTLSLISMESNLLVKSAGFENIGVTHPLNVIKENTPSGLDTCLKMASGFGGCNAAILIKKQSR